VKLDYQVFENRPMGFRRMLVWAKHLINGVNLEGVMFCCETTGGYDRSLCDYLFTKGLDIWRESSLQIKQSSGLRKGKDDKADSLAIAEYAMRHIDKAVYYVSPSGTVRDLKALLLYRRKLEQEKTSKKVRVAELKSTAAKSKSVSFILRDAQKSIKMLEKSIKECEKQILALYDSDEELRRSYEHLISINGLGIVNATAMIAYTNNFKNITTSRKLASYYGIAPFREKSGTSVDKKAFIKQYSSSMLRAYLTQAAQWTIKEHGIYHDYYLRMSAKGKCYGIILNNIKNKLLHLSVSLIVNDMDYEENHEFLRAQRIA
jgi:transposase